MYFSKPEKLPPLEKDPAMKTPIDWGVKTDASKVDEYIYTEDLKMSVFTG
ncbi:MAG: hypothetical protein OIN66_15370 [Candidatus Methanoperedens sp.]|nr:hypothetical protein [Candidatus Methanoperedens sp.]